MIPASEAADVLDLDTDASTKCLDRTGVALDIGTPPTGIPADRVVYAALSRTKDCSAGAAWVEAAWITSAANAPTYYSAVKAIRQLQRTGALNSVVRSIAAFYSHGRAGRGILTIACEASGHVGTQGTPTVASSMIGGVP